MAEQDQWETRHTATGAPYGSLHESECKQQISLAFTHAIITAARCTVVDLKVDVERVDYTVRQVAQHTVYSSAQIDVQMKCTSQDVLKSDGVHWTLSRDHYDKLRDPNTYNRKILVVLVVPKKFDDWVKVEKDQMLLAGAAYWICLEGEPAVDTDSKTVVLPKSNIFNVDQLLDILQRVGDGGKP